MAPRSPPADRAMSTPLSHVLSVAITTVLILALVSSATGFLDAQKQRSAGEELRTIGNRLAGELAEADALARNGDAVTVMTRHPETVAGSDLVGYVLTVGIILTSVDIVATVGVDQIERAQGHQNVQSAERAMELLAGNLAELQESRAAVREATLSVDVGSIDVLAGGSPSEVTINVSGTGDTPTTYDLGTIAYRLEDATVTYEGGGVFLDTTQRNAIPLVDPTFVCTDNRAVVSIVTLQGSAAPLD